jgi:hypothetical protein
MKARIAVALLFAFAVAVVAQVPDVTGIRTAPAQEVAEWLMFPFNAVPDVGGP